MAITTTKVSASDWTDLGAPGRRSLLMLLPPGTVITGTATIGTTTVALATRSVTAKVGKAQGVMIEVWLRNDATLADVGGSLGTLSAVGWKKRSIQLNDGQTLTLSVTTPEGTHSIVVGGIIPLPPYTNTNTHVDPPVVTTITPINLATVKITLYDGAEPGAGTT